MTACQRASRVAITEAAETVLRQLEAEHGPLLFHQSGGLLRRQRPDVLPPPRVPDRRSVTSTWATSEGRPFYIGGAAVRGLAAHPAADRRGPRPRRRLLARGAARRAVPDPVAGVRSRRAGVARRLPSQDRARRLDSSPFSEDPTRPRRVLPYSKVREQPGRYRLPSRAPPHEQHQAPDPRPAHPRQRSRPHPRCPHLRPPPGPAVRAEASRHPRGPYPPARRLPPGCPARLPPRHPRDPRGQLAGGAGPRRPRRPPGGDHRPGGAEDDDQRAQLRRQGLHGATSRTPSPPAGRTWSRARPTARTPSAAPSPSPRRTGRQYRLGERHRDPAGAAPRLAPGGEARPPRRRAGVRQPVRFRTLLLPQRARSSGAGAADPTSISPSSRATSRPGCGTMSSPLPRTGSASPGERSGPRS